MCLELGLIMCYIFFMKVNNFRIGDVVFYVFICNIWINLYKEVGVFILFCFDGF